ncbi:MAG: hypothetical protein ACTSRP_05580 [Candidatus Helarchaeota archaeon]
MKYLKNKKIRISIYLNLILIISGIFIFFLITDFKCNICEKNLINIKNYVLAKNSYQSYSISISANEILNINYNASDNFDFHIFTDENFKTWAKSVNKSRTISIELSSFYILSSMKLNISFNNPNLNYYQMYYIVFINRNNVSITSNQSIDLNYNYYSYNGLNLGLEISLMLINLLIVFIYIIDIKSEKLKFEIFRNEKNKNSDNSDNSDIYNQFKISRKALLIQSIKKICNSKTFYLILLILISLIFSFIPFFILWPSQIYGDEAQFFMRYSNFELYNVFLPASLYYSITRFLLIYSGLPYFLISKIMRIILSILSIMVFYLLCGEFCKNNFLNFLVSFLFVFNIYNVILIAHAHKQFLAIIFLLIFILFYKKSYNINRNSSRIFYLLLSTIFLLISMLSSEFCAIFIIISGLMLSIIIHIKKLGKKFFIFRDIAIPFYPMIFIISGLFGLFVMNPNLLNKLYNALLNTFSTQPFYNYYQNIYYLDIIRWIMPIFSVIIGLIFFKLYYHSRIKLQLNSINKLIKNKRFYFLKKLTYFSILLFSISLYVMSSHYTFPLLVFNLLTLFLFDYFLTILLNKNKICFNIFSMFIYIILVSINFLAYNYYLYPITEFVFYPERFVLMIYPFFSLALLLSLNEFFYNLKNNTLQDYGFVISKLHKFKPLKKFFKKNLVYIIIFACILIPNLYLNYKHFFSTFIYHTNNDFSWITKYYQVPLSFTNLPSVI